MAPGAAENSSSHAALLRQVSRIANSGCSLQQILDSLVRLTAEATCCDATLVYHPDAETNEIVLRASRLPHEGEAGTLRTEIGEGFTASAAFDKSLVAPPSNAVRDERFRPFPTLPDGSYEPLLSVPLSSGGRIVGVMNVHDCATRAHTPDEIALVTFIAEQMGGAIAKARLEERASRALRGVQALAEMARAVSEQDRLDRILQIISETVAETLQAALCCIILVDENRPGLRVCAGRGSPPEDSLVEQVVLHRRALSFRNLPNSADFSSIYAAPLIARENVRGVLTVRVSEDREFRPDETGFVQAVAGHAAIAVENARLLLEVDEMKRSLEARKLVERAKGILQHRHNLSEEQAYLRLRNECRRLRRPMRELAEAVIVADRLEHKAPRPAAM